MIDKIGGYRIIESRHMVIDGPLKEVNRTWIERLFSLPWRPLQRTKMVPTYLPNPKIIRQGLNLIMHPVIAHGLRKAVAEMWEEGE